MLTTTELELVELTDFEPNVECEFGSIDGQHHEAHVYLGRPPCPCFPNGKVFPACRDWVTQHPRWGITVTVCCGKFYSHKNIVYVGDIRP